MNNTDSTSRKKIFIDWLSNQEINLNELDHDLAKANQLKFNNHCDNADEKEFISEDVLESAFNTVMKSSR